MANRKQMWWMTIICIISNTILIQKISHSLENMWPGSPDRHSSTLILTNIMPRSVIRNEKKKSHFFWEYNSRCQLPNQSQSIWKLIKRLSESRMAKVFQRQFIQSIRCEKMSCNSAEWLCSYQDSPDFPNYRVRLFKKAKYKMVVFKIKRRINLNYVKQRLLKMFSWIFYTVSFVTSNKVINIILVLPILK